MPMYVDQPLFSDQELLLRRLGFITHQFFPPVVGHALKPFIANGDPHGPLSQMFWADVVFIRDFTRLDRLTPVQLIKLAMILHDVYGSVDVANLALAAYDRVQGTELSASYVAAVSRG
jgi:hypothetical protein